MEFKINKIVILAQLMLCVTCGITIRRPFKRPLYDCPPRDPVTQQNVPIPFAPVVAIPPMFYANESQSVWVSVAEEQSGHIRRPTVKLYLAYLNGSHISNTECKTVETENSERSSLTSKVDMMFPVSVLKTIADEALVVVRWAWEAESNREPPVWYEVRMQVRVLPPYFNVILQTDKPLYRPDQKVHLTVYSLTRHMKPVSTRIVVDVIGPDGLLHSRNTSQTPVTGVFRLQFELPPIATHGNWSIQARYGHDLKQITKIQLYVMDYLLPTFTVAINMDKAMHVPMYNWHGNTITTKITAKHVHGTNVEGSMGCSASYTKKVSYGEKNGDKIGIEFYSVSGISLQNGEATINIKLPVGVEVITNLEALLLYVKCNVTECMSAITRSVSAEMLLKKKKFYVNFASTSKMFKPNLPYYLQAVISDMYEDFAPNVNCEVIVTDCETRVSRAPIRVVSNSKGKIETLIHNVNESELCIQVKLIDSDILEDHRICAVPRASQYLSLVPRNGSLSNTGEFQLYASHPQIIRTLYILNYVRHMIVEYRRDKVHFFQNPRILDFPALSESAPQARLMVFYYANKDNGELELISDSFTVDVEPTCMNGVTADKNVYLPKDTLNLNYTGAVGTTIVTQAIIEEALALNPQHVLTSAMITSALSSNYKEFDIRTCLLSETFETEPPATLDVIEETTETMLNCCQWAREQYHNIELSPCSDIVTKLLLMRNVTKQCVSEARECCIEWHESSGEENVEYVEYPGYLSGSNYELIDADIQPISDRDPNVVKESLYKPVDIQKQEDTIAFDMALRSNFEETIVLPLKTIGMDREMLTSFQLSDSLTNWYIQTVFLHEHRGMCVLPALALPVRKDVFLHVSMPEKIVVGEYAEISAAVYNTGNSTSRSVIQIIDISEELCFNVSGSNHTPMVQKGENVVRHWVVVPTKAGKHRFTVRLLDGDVVVDAVEKDLIVDDLGFEINNERQHFDILLPTGNVSFDVNRPLNADGDVQMKLQFNANLLRPNSETAVFEGHSFAFEDIFIQATSLLYTYKYMVHFDFNELDTSKIREELGLALDNLLYKENYIGVCSETESVHKAPLCNARLAHFVTFFVLELKDMDLAVQYKASICDIIDFTLTHHSASEILSTCLHATFQQMRCRLNYESPMAESNTPDDIGHCYNTIDGFKSLLGRSESYLEMLEQELNNWKEQGVQLSLSKASRDQIEDGVWLLYNSYDAKTVADPLAAWILKHRNDYGAFVTYSDTLLASHALYKYSLMAAGDHVSGITECVVSIAAADGINEEFNIPISDPSVTQTLDVSPYIDATITVACSRGLVSLEALATYRIIDGATKCPLDITINVASSRRGGGRGRGKRAADCSNDEDSLDPNYRYDVEVCLDDTESLREQFPSDMKQVVVTVSLFSGYRPEKSISGIDTWEYVKEQSSMRFIVSLKGGFPICGKFRKAASYKVDNIQPGLVTVSSPAFNLHCSKIYHYNDEQPLLNRPSTCL